MAASDSTRGRSRDRDNSLEGRGGRRRRRSSSFSDFSSSSPPPPHPPMATTNAPSQPTSFVKDKIFVERLTRNIHEGHIMEIFGAYGRIVNVRHHKLRGWAHIQYESEQSATLAIHCMNDGQVDGNVIKVSPFRLAPPKNRWRHSRSPVQRRRPSVSSY